MPVFLGMQWGERGAGAPADGLITHLPWRMRRRESAVHVLPVTFTVIIGGLWESGTTEDRPVLPSDYET